MHNCQLLKIKGTAQEKLILPSKESAKHKDLKKKAFTITC